MDILRISLTIAEQFTSEREKDFADNPLAKMIRKEWPESFYKACPEQATIIKVKASAGMGQWNAAPFMAFLDPIITTSPQSGYYPVILYERGFESFCLVMAQGADSLKESYGTKGALPILKNRVPKLRAAAIGWEKKGFIEGPFQTYSRGNASLGRNIDDPWAASVAFGKRYEVVSPPNLATFVEDLRAMLELYERIVSKVGREFIEEEKIAEQLSLSGELPKVDASGIDGALRVDLHKKSERRIRNSKLVKHVKAMLGSTCQGCGITLHNVYGDIGKDFIEAHHLTPLALAPKEGVHLTTKDFTVLCPTCHRIIHRLGCPDIEVLRQNVNSKIRNFYATIEKKQDAA
jgi:5-methylcytosine-specific restriction protein A